MATTFDVISLGNLADMDTVEGDNVADNASALVGLTLGDINDPLADHIASFSPGTGGYAGGAADYYDQDNSPAENFRIDGGPDQVFDSAARFNATITYTDGTTATANIAVFQDTAGNTYLLPEISQNATQNAFEAGAIRSITLDSLSANTTQGLYADRDNAEFVTCYAPGTLIDTPDGPRAVETLKPGDLVQTFDHGPQPIRWVRSNDHPLEDIEADCKPVLIKAGSLGHGRPSRDLIVSPQHRILVGGAGQLDGWFKTEVFVPSKALTHLPGIRHMGGKTQITWMHFACQAHEVVFANDCLTESLLLGPMVLQNLTGSELRTLTDLFGEPSSPDAALNGPAARDCLKVGQVRRHIAKCKKNKEQRVAREIRKWDRDLAMERHEAQHLREVWADSAEPLRRAR